MKAKHLLMAMALPVAFAACSQEEIVSNSNEGNDIPKLAKDFTLVAEKANDVESRGAYVENAAGGHDFKWVLDSERLGVCWTGKVGEVDYTDQANKNLYTNYLFEDIAGADELNSDGSLKSPSTTPGEKYTYANFATTASSLFAGQYVVYSPYSENFKGVGKIQASTPAEVNVTSTSEAAQLESVTPKMFLMSNRTDLVGGQQTAGFTLHVKSTILDLKMQLAKGEATNKIKVDKVILFDETKLASVIEYDADGTKGDVTYGHMSISANYSNAVTLDPDNDALDQLKSFMIPVLTENLKATTRIYVHDKTSGKWAMVPFTTEYALEEGVKPLTLPSFKVSDFNMTLITSAKEFADAVKSAKANDVIDILTDITVKNGDFTAGYNGYAPINITSGTGATLKLDVNDAPFEFGATGKTINFDCDVEVIDSNPANVTNPFTLKCPSNIYGNFTNNVEQSTFNAIVNVEEDGKLTNNGGLTIPGTMDLAVFGAVENNGEIAIASGADFLINGRNAAVVNNGTISNKGNMTVIKYNTNSVLNNGVAVVGVNGQFTGDFDAASTGSFWKEVDTKEMFEEALVGNYTKVVLLAGTYNYSAITTDAVINAGDKDIEFVSGAILSLPTNDAIAPNSNDFTLVTTGEITLHQIATWGNDIITTPQANITIQAGELNVKAELTIEETGTLIVTGDINANAAVNFNYHSTASFVNFNNLAGGSFNSAQGANVTYTGRINF